MAEDMQESNEMGLLSYQRNVTISNYILHEACQLYFKAYKRKLMPLSFAEFVFNEYKRYDIISSAPVLDFFKVYKPMDLAIIVENYETNFFSLIVGNVKRKDEFYLRLQNSEYMTADLSDPNMFRDYDPDLYTNLDNISKHIDGSDELLSTKDLYEQFMIRKVVLSRSTKNRTAVRQAAAKIAPVISAVYGERTNEKPAEQEASRRAVEDEFLIGSKTDIPNQKGRVVRMYFPKLMLPSPYPILQEKSRINSEHRAHKFMSTDRQVKMIDKMKFNRVKYKTGFIQKRKAAQKTTKHKFDFDF